MKSRLSSIRQRPSQAMRDAGIVVGVSVVLCMLALFAFSATLPV